MSDITLSAGVRSNLLSLQNTAKMMEQTQTRLATGKEVNSALDDPTNFFTSQSLNARSNDLSSLLDSMSNGTKTLEAADNGLTSISKTLETMQATLRQARQDASFQTQSFGVDLGDSPDGTESLDFTGGAFGTATESMDVASAQGTFSGSGFDNIDFSDGASAYGQGGFSFDVSVNGEDAQTVAIDATDGTTLEVTIDGGSATTFTVDDADAVTEDEIAGALNAAFDDNDVAITVDTEGGELVLTADEAVGSSDAEVNVTNVTETDLNAGGSGLDGGSQDLTNIEAMSVDALVNAINSNADLNSNIRASNDNGELRIENLSTQDLTVTGVNSEGDIDGGTGTSEIGGNEVRAGLADEFNTLRDQLDKLSDDASFNGINLLRGDKLTLTFNETGTSEIDIQTQSGEAINSANLDLFNIEASQLDGNSSIDGLIEDVSNALNDVRAQSSNFGSNLSIVENRTEFTERMMNTLQTGADSLVLADTNEEGANMLALQTRQQLSSTALSMASQADQAVLRLF